MIFPMQPNIKRIPENEVISNLPDILTMDQQHQLWDQVCCDPLFANFIYKVETNQLGQLIISNYWNPEFNERDMNIVNSVRNQHSFYQTEISFILNRLLPIGYIGVEYAVKTYDGTKNIDVAWRSDRGTLDIGDSMPEICIEVVSPGNTKKEIENKKRLYLECGASEVWTCQDGIMSFFDKTGKIINSNVCSSFPLVVKI